MNESQYYASLEQAVHDDNHIKYCCELKQGEVDDWLKDNELTRDFIGFEVMTKYQTKGIEWLQSFNGILEHDEFISNEDCKILPGLLFEIGVLLEVGFADTDFEIWLLTELDENVDHALEKARKETRDNY